MGGFLALFSSRTPALTTAALYIFFLFYYYYYFLHLMGLQEAWSSSGCLFLREPVIQCLPPHPKLPFYATTTVVWGHLNAPLAETPTPFQSMVGSVVRSARPVAHLAAWCCSCPAEDIAFSNPPPFPPSPNDNTGNPFTPPPTTTPRILLFYWFDCPRVGRWRTSKQCSPMSVIWWRWRKASLHQRPGRVRKSSYPSPGKHIC